MKFVKIIFGLIFSLTVILLVALLALSFVVDFNEYKPLIAEKVEQATGRQLNIKGDIKIAVWPWLGVQVVNAELSNAPGFGDKPFARVSEFDLKLALLPLLQKKINVDKILLQGLSLSLQKNSEGQNNWDDLIKQKQPQDTPAEIKSEDESLMALGTISIQGVKIKKGTLKWQDKKTQTELLIDDINLELGALALNEDMPLVFSAHGKSNSPEADIKFNLESAINIDLDTRHIALNQSIIDIRVLTPTLLAQNTSIKLTSSFSANLNEQQYKIIHLEMDASTKGYQLPGGELNLKLKTSSLIDLVQQTVDVESIQMESTGMRLKSSAKITKLDTAPVVEGELSLAEFNPTDVAEAYKINFPVMPDNGALQKMQAQFNYRVSHNKFELNNLSLKLDDSAIHGQLSINDFNSPKLKYNIGLTEIKLDRYVPMSASSNQRSAQSSELSNASIELPVDALRQLNIDGVFKANKIEWRDYKFKNLYIKTRARKGVVVMNPVNVRLFGGRVALAARLDTRTRQAKYSLNVKAKDLQLAFAAEPVLRNILNENKASLNGKVNLNAKLSAQGNTAHDLVSSLKGRFDFRTGKTQLKNADVEYYLRQRAWYTLDKKIRKSSRAVVAALKKNNFPLTEKEFMEDYRPRDKTVFNVIRAKANINKGVVNNYEFLMASDRVNVNGKGKIYLTNQRMDYAAEIDLHRSNNSLKDQLLDIPLAINLNGPFATLKPQANINAWLGKAWNVVESKGKSRIKRKVRQKVKDKYKDMLKQWQY